MKKTLLLAGAVAAFALINLDARSADAPKAPDAVTSTNKTAATCPMGGAGAAGATCSKGDKASAPCPKAGGDSKAAASCPKAKGSGRTCPITGATGKTDKPADASEKPADKDAK